MNNDLREALEMAESEIRFLKMAIDADDPKEQLNLRCVDMRARIRKALAAPAPETGGEKI